MDIDHILTISNKREEKFLRAKTIPFDFASRSRKDIDYLIKTMKQKMKEADGIGLAANQVGISERFFVASVPTDKEGYKFYAIFNPHIEKYEEEGIELEEGCLSVPGNFGPVLRSKKVFLKGQDKMGKQIKIKAWGLLARVFQHEVDHLDGKLFIDKARFVEKIEDK